MGPLVRKTMRFCSGVIGRDTPGFEHDMLAVIAPKDTAESDGSLAISFCNFVFKHREARLLPSYCLFDFTLTTYVISDSSHTSTIKIDLESASLFDNHHSCLILSSILSCLLHLQPT